MHHQVQGMITMKKLPQKKVIILKSITTDIDLLEKHYEPLSIWVVPNFGLAHGLLEAHTLFLTGLFSFISHSTCQHFIVTFVLHHQANGAKGISFGEQP